MLDTIANRLMNVSSGRDKEVLQFILKNTVGLTQTVALTSAGLLISGTTTKVATAAAPFYCMVKGRLVRLGNSTDMAPLVGTVTNAKFNVYCFYVDNAGTLTSAMGVEGAAIGSVLFPDKPIDKVFIGFVIINPTGTGPFIGGTTALGDVTVVPNAAYVSLVGASDPTILYN
jgi:hypothetical protein